MKNTLRVLSVRGNRNGDTMWKRGIKIPASTFDFHNNEFFIPISILKNNQNTLMNRR